MSLELNPAAAAAAASHIATLSYRLIAQPCDGIPAHTCPLISFSYLITVHAHTGHFGHPREFTPGAAALAFLSRLLVHHEILVSARARAVTPFQAKDDHIHWIKCARPHVFASLRRSV